MKQDRAAMPGPLLQGVSVIVPTLCDGRRAALIERLLASIAVQAVPAEVLLVVNGDRYDLALLQRMRDDPALTVLQLAEGNVSAARHAGLLHASREFFCFIDDDDVFLPGALQTRLELLRAHPGVDVLVTNGFELTHGRERLFTSLPAARINATPALAILEQNWFASPAATYRRSSVDASFFDMRHAFFELTYLFFRLHLAGKVFLYDARPTYRKDEDNPLSVSKSDEYADFYPKFLRQLRAMPVERAVWRQINKKYLRALNALSRRRLDNRQLAQAWHAHIHCLALGGWRYLPYTRRLLAAALAPRAVWR